MEEFFLKVQTATLDQLQNEEWLTASIASIGLFPDTRGDQVYGDDIQYVKEEGLYQIPRQLAQYLIQLTKIKKIKNFLDIGTFQGYTITTICIYLLRFNPDLMIDAVDIESLVMPAIRNIWSKYSLPISYRPVQLAAHYDVAFIDGDHSYDAVRRDYETIRPISDVLTFHDINDQWCPGVVQLWNEIKNENCYEFTWHSRGYRSMGIGLPLA